MMSHIDAKERLLVMRRQEDSLYYCSDYFEQLSPPQNGTESNNTIDPLCRKKMATWCFQVIDFIQFSRETVSISMNYLDRFLCSGCPRAEQVLNCRREYQLASMTALFMAIKINEPIMIDMVMLTELSKGIYTKEDFRKMETDILFGLNWRVSGPTAQSFVVHLLELIQQQQEQELLPQYDQTGNTTTTEKVSFSLSDVQKIYEISAYQIELSVGEHEFITQKPSIVAIASIWNCIEEYYDNTDDGTLSIFHRQLLNAVSSLESMQMEEQEFHDVKETLSKLSRDGSRTMQMRPISSFTNLAPHSRLHPGDQDQQNQMDPSPRSSVPQGQSQQRPPCTAGDKDHCSPICVSKRDLFGNSDN